MRIRRFKPYNWPSGVLTSGLQMSGSLRPLQNKSAPSSSEINTLDSTPTFTDHLGVTHDVHPRNDITVNRAMFILGGYIFDKRALYSFTVWTSAGAASIIVAGNIGWRFSKALTLTAGYTGVPGSRSLVATFPLFYVNR